MHTLATSRAVFSRYVSNFISYCNMNGIEVIIGEAQAAYLHHIPFNESSPGIEHLQAHKEGLAIELSFISDDRFVKADSLLQSLKNKWLSYHPNCQVKTGIPSICTHFILKELK